MTIVKLIIKTCSLFFFGILLLIGCQQEPENTTIPVDPTEIENLQVFVDFEQHGLLTPIQVEMLPNNNLAVLDNQTNKVLIFNTEGDLVTSFGGEGRGPGESISARQLQVSDGYIYVFDSRLLRLNQFSFSGEFIESYTIESRQGVTVTDDNTYYESAMGEEGSLFKKVNLETDSTQFMGEALSEPDEQMDLDKERNLLQRGEIPNHNKNLVTMYYSDPYLYVFLDSFSRLQKYSTDGNLLWDQHIDMPENEIIFNDVVERAQEPGAPGTVPVFRYITSMKVIEGDTYIFWYPVKDLPRKLVKIDSSGNLDSIYHIPEEVPTFFDFTIDTENEFLYLIAPELGQIHRAKYPD